jgi:polysaccharide export outer membrane protein
MKNILLITAVIIVAVTSCTTPNVTYFNDMKNSQNEAIKHVLDIRLRPDDKLTIVVKSQDQRLSELFNLAIYQQRVGSTTGSSQYMSGYTVDSQGNIDFPVLGQLHVAGMMREEVAKLIKDELINRKQINDPHVTVEYANFSVDVMGEVNKPGRYQFDRDHITLLDALSMAGDLTIFGQRDSVKVIRANGFTNQTTYVVNLQRGDELYASPAFYLQQNDVIYVAPNDYRARQSTINGNNVRSTSFWISIASLAASLTSVIYMIVK